MSRLLPSFVQTCFLFLACLAMLGVGFLSESINKERKKYLTHNTPMENAPPELVLATTALGGFRSIVINVLWIRAIKMSEDGKHYELVQLYDWISKLEPRIPEVWHYTAWEMAYNISVKFPTGEERWRWIWKGMEQLRDYGIRYNKNAPTLYFQLSYLIYDKIGMDSLDRQRFYYQRELVRIMGLLVENTNPRELSKAPQTREEILQNTSIKELIKELHENQLLPKEISEQNENILPALLNQIENRQPQLFHYLLNYFQKKYQRLGKEQKKSAYAEELSNKGKLLRKLRNKYWVSEKLRAIDNYLKAKILRERFKMDPKEMFAIDKKYYPLDWRLASAHSLYWAEQGQKCIDRLFKKWLFEHSKRLFKKWLKEYFEGQAETVDREEQQQILVEWYEVWLSKRFSPKALMKKKSTQFIDACFREWLGESKSRTIASQNIDRMQFISLRQNFEYGYPLADMKPRGIIYIPNFQLIKKLHHLFLHLTEKWEYKDIGLTSHETFLRDIVKNAYIYGYRKLASNYYKFLKDRFKNGNYPESLDDYAVIEIGRKMGTWGRRHEIEGYLIGALFSAYSHAILAQNNEMKQHVKKLKQFVNIGYAHYIKRHGRNISELDKDVRPLSMGNIRYYAATLVKHRVMENNARKYGLEKAESLWKNLEEEYPFLKHARKTQEKN